MPNTPPDIEAEITFLKTEDGGRKLPAYTGYRCPHNFWLPGIFNDAHHEFINQDSVAPGETIISNMWFLAPELQQGRLYPGFKFTLCEGRVIGNGVITKVFNKLLCNGI